MFCWGRRGPDYLLINCFFTTARKVECQSSVVFSLPPPTHSLTNDTVRSSILPWPTGTTIVSLLRPATIFHIRHSRRKGNMDEFQRSSRIHHGIPRLASHDLFRRHRHATDINRGHSAHFRHDLHLSMHDGPSMSR